jgi:hypothetical protein
MNPQAGVVTLGVSDLNRPGSGTVDWDRGLSI